MIINIFVQRHKVVTSEALGPGSVLLRTWKRESPGVFSSEFQTAVCMSARRTVCAK